MRVLAILAFVAVVAPIALAEAARIELDDPEGDSTLAGFGLPVGGLSCPRTDIVSGMMERTATELVLSFRIRDGAVRCATDPAEYGYHARYTLATAFGELTGESSLWVAADGSWSEHCTYDGGDWGYGWGCASGGSFSGDEVTWRLAAESRPRDVSFSTRVCAGPTVGSCVRGFVFADRLPDAGFAQPPS